MEVNDIGHVKVLNLNQMHGLKFKIPLEANLHLIILVDH